MGFAKAALLLMTLTVLQVTLLSDLRFFGVTAQSLLALSVAVGLMAGSRYGAIFGFVAGLCLDLYLATPFGLSAMAFSCAAALVGLAAHSTEETSRLGHAFFVAAGSMIGATIYALAGAGVGRTDLIRAGYPKTVLIIGVLNGLLGFVLVPAAKWMLNNDWTSRGGLFARV